MNHDPLKRDASVYEPLMTGWGNSSVQFSHSVVSNSLQNHGLQHARTLCPSPSPEVAQVHVHCIGDAIQPSHLLTLSSSALNLSQHQGLFQRVSCSHQMTKYWSFSFSIVVLPSIQG